MPFLDSRFAGHNPNGTLTEKTRCFDSFDHALTAKNKGRPPDCDGRFALRERASQYSHPIFLKGCPKLPEQAKRLWRNSGVDPFEGHARH
jgi:hypothetical protein